jgi:cobaltochelatase CobS
MGYAQPSEFTPQNDPYYIFQDAMRDIIVWFLEKSDPLYIFGPVGCGKTSCVKQVSSMLNYPVFEITGHSRLEFPELVGHLSVKNGDMFFQYGPLALAMKYGGVFLLNEIDLLDPSTAAGLNSVLDGSNLCIMENSGELIEPNPMFRFVATANTNGASDETGLYRGTLKQNISFMDRFQMCEITYPDSKLEEDLLNKIAPTLGDDLIKKMVKYAGSVRKLFINSNMGFASGESENQTILEITFSTRTLIRWAKLSVKYNQFVNTGNNVLYALDRALSLRATTESRTYLREFAQRTFNIDEVKSTDSVQQDIICNKFLNSLELRKLL